MALKKQFILSLSILATSLAGIAISDLTVQTSPRRNTASSNNQVSNTQLQQQQQPITIKSIDRIEITRTVFSSHQEQPLSSMATTLTNEDRLIGDASFVLTNKTGKKIKAVIIHLYSDKSGLANASKSIVYDDDERYISPGEERQFTIKHVYFSHDVRIKAILFDDGDFISSGIKNDVHDAQMLKSYIRGQSQAAQKLIPIIRNRIQNPDISESMVVYEIIKLRPSIIEDPLKSDLAHEQEAGFKDYVNHIKTKIEQAISRQNNTNNDLKPYYQMLLSQLVAKAQERS